MINRTAFVVRPRQPFVDWVNTVDATTPLSLASARVEPQIYLVPDWAGDDVETAIEQYWEMIFEEELVGWYTDEPSWPDPRTLAMFREWFDVEMCSMITDLVDAPLELED